MKALLSLNGGINKDVNPLYIESDKGEVSDRVNCRVQSFDGSRVGINVSIKGMQQVSASLPSGTNTIIGYIEDKERDQGIFFNKNSNGNDSIYVYNGTSVTNLGVPSGVLNFSTSYPIQADIIGDYCVFTDNNNPPRKVKITNASGVSASNILSTVDAYDVQLAVRPPSSAPTIAIGSDSTKKVNKIAGKAFQFAYFYVYDDYTYSVLSPYSEIAVSNSMFNTGDNTFVDNSIGNFITVTYNIGADNVRSVKLLAREGNSGSWFVVTEFEKGSETEFTTKDYSFYNDVARQGLVETEALSLYSDVPLKAKSVLSVQNRIALANVLKGYDKTEVDFNISVVYEDVDITTSSTPLTSHYGVDGNTAYIGWDIPASVTAGDVFSINIFSAYLQYDGTEAYAFKIEYNFTYTVQAGDTQSDVIDAFYNDIMSKVAEITTDQYYGGKFYGVDYTVYADTSFVGGSVGIVFGQVYSSSGGLGSGLTDGSYYLGEEADSFSVETQPTGVSTYKAGSYYNVGVMLYDDFGRTSGVLSSKRVYIPFNGERDYADVGKKAKLSFTINNSSVASWAKKYRFAVTESVNFAGVYPFVAGNNTATNIYATYLDGQDVLAINMPTNFQYEFRKGDFLILEYDTGAAITTTSKAIIGTRTTITISGDEKSGFWLIVPQGDESTSDYNGALVSIYRPKDEVADLVYYEDVNTYTATNSVMQTLTGYIDSGDAWFVARDFKWDGGADTTEVVEDFYINVDFASRAYSQGRAVVEFDTLGQIRLQDFVWSFNYLDNTKINGISTFNSLNRKQLDEKNGEIQALKLVSDVVKVIQDNKETSLYVGKAQISDAEGNLQVVQSNDFIGTVYPSQTDYGSRYARSVVRNNNYVYYWDGDRGQVVRSSSNGQFPISDYGMKSEFLRIKRAIDAVPNNSSVLAFYDVRNDEYVITFKIGTSNETWAFKEGLDRWIAKYDFKDSSGNIPNAYGNIGELSLSFLNDSVWLHERSTLYNYFYGDLKTFYVKGILNIYPTEEKCARAIKIDSSEGFDTEITSPITNTRPVGQKSLLYTETWVSREGSYTSPVFSNILGSAGIEYLSLIHSGDDMVGKYIEFAFDKLSSNEIQLSNAIISFTVNK